jgi:SAM-dependent methyltransferase
MDLSSAVSLIQSPLVNSAHPARWADLGAGSGLFTKALAGLLSAGSEIYAADKKPVSVFSDFPRHITLHQLTIDFVTEELPFNELDGILMANSFHYVKEKMAFIKKLIQALKKTGMLLVVEYDSNVPVGNWVPYPVDFLNLKILFMRAGFRTVEKLGEYPSVYGRKMYSAVICRVPVGIS